MTDIGTNAANAVVGLTAEGMKTVLKASAEIVKQLLILSYQSYQQNYQQKAGITNLKGLLKRLDSGDRLCDIVIPKEDIQNLSKIAKNHGVQFAVAEITKDDNFTVYYPESQSNRMVNVLNALASLEEKKSKEEKKADKGTSVIFDPKQPEHILELKSELAEDGKDGTVIYLHQKGKEAQSLTMEQAEEVMQKMQEPKVMEINEDTLKELNQSDRGKKIQDLVAAYIGSMEKEEAKENQEETAEGEERKTLLEWKEKVKEIKTISKEEETKEVQPEIQTQIKEAVEKGER